MAQESRDGWEDKQEDARPGMLHARLQEAALL